jgi:PrtD family type I secretion system ABC transporter
MISKLVKRLGVSSQHLVSVSRELDPHYRTIVVFSATINILMLAPSWYMLQVYDRVLTSYDENTLLGLSLIVIFLYAVYSLLERYRGMVLIGISEGIESRCGPLVQRALLDPAPNGRSNALNGVGDLNTVKHFLTGQPMIAVLDSPFLLVYVLVIFLLHPLLGLLATLSVLCLFAVAILNQQSTSEPLAAAQQEASAERGFSAVASESAQSIKAMGMRPALLQRMASLRSRYLSHLLVASTTGVDWSAAGKFIRVLIQSAMLGLGAYLAIRNEITPGMMIAASILLGRAFAPIEGLIGSWKQFSEFRRALKELDGLLDRTNPESRAIDLGRPSGAIEVKDACLSLREEARPTLNKITLRIPGGEILAIIGPSGAGKTSLLKLMSGLYRPQSGHVYIDGADMAHRDLDELGPHVGYLSQTDEILEGSIAENIARFQSVDEEAVLLASRLVGAHEVAVSLPKGYDTIISDGGSNLSQGQRRKIALARALYKFPAILFLDEPSNGLDDASTKQLLKALAAIQGNGCTIVVTTHHNALVQLAHKVAVVVEGELALMGERQLVMAKLSERQQAT